MSIVKYDGSRFITEEDIDREFTGHYVLLFTGGKPNAHEGFLVASGVGSEETYSELSDLSIIELNAQAKIIYGCKTRGDSLHVQLLG